MNVRIINEYGYSEALFGIGLSYGLTSGRLVEEFCFNSPLYNRMKKVATNLAGKGLGEDKFLRCCHVVLDCTFARYFWPEFDQYKVGTVSLSESTRHTLGKQPFTEKDFEHTENGWPLVSDERIEELNHIREEEGWDSKQLRANLPESYLQRRIIFCNYAVLRNIISQRKNHKLWEWHRFCKAILQQSCHPELLRGLLPDNYE